MFGPNYRYETRTPVYYDHRGQGFEDLVEDVRYRLKHLFNLQGWDILFIPGPASLAMQVVISSLRASDMTVHGDGKFDQRWRSVVNSSFTPTGSAPASQVACLLETSTSHYRPSIMGPGTWIIDAVSGFPYYPIPKLADIFVTTCCKQLGAAPGLSIVGVKHAWSAIREKSWDWDYMDLRLHAEEFIPTTVNPQIFEQLNRSLVRSHFESQDAKIRRVGMLLDAQLDPDITIGQRVCPVVTVRKDRFDRRYPGLAKKYDLYPGSSHPESDRYHIFTYSEPTELYLNLVEDLRCWQT